MGGTVTLWEGCGGAGEGRGEGWGGGGGGITVNRHFGVCITITAKVGCK